MTRSIALAAALTLCTPGCQQENLQQEQQSEQRELAEEQRREQRELEEEQARERARAAETAQRDLDDRAQEVREGRQELNAANEELDRTITLACNGVATPDQCPVGNAAVQSSSNVDNGVSLTLNADSGSRAEVEQRIDCYRARATLRGAPDRGACLIDLTDDNVTVQVTERDGRVVVAMTNTNNDNDWVTRVREEARQIRANMAARRQGAERN